MKQGRSLQELAGEVYRQAESKRDYIADTRVLRMDSNGSSRLTVPAEEGPGMVFGMNETCHRQVAERSGIPWPYYQKMQDSQPGLLDQNVNTWWQAKPEKRMVRTLDGTARAFLSDRYRRLDNVDLLSAALEPLSEIQGLTVASSEITEHKFYLKVTTEKVQGEVKKGDIVQAGLQITNSEIGGGAVRVQPLIFRLACLNGMVVPDFGQRKYHVGRGSGADDNSAYEMFRDETLQADDKAFWMRVQDVVRGSFSGDTFEKILSSIRETSQVGIEGDPVSAVEALSNRFSFTEGEQGLTLRHLVAGGDLSGWGLINAVTRTSQDLPSYDRASEFEAVGGQLLALPPADWRAILNN